MLLLFRPRVGGAVVVVTVTGMFDQPSPDPETGNFDEPAPAVIAAFDSPTPS